ncbi:MAG: cation transport protein-domain-containing protein [Olpidium bornovanus]|uniref:Cation transport protein-domain-containing protein n=1 Tax=Olpidium bornovanus TaxID=278681 RepID=A0A8H8DJP5_9FUNG|nr:MAG: cation transport protein-domain-containing protein [Olpidium bornovanus]
MTTGSMLVAVVLTTVGSHTVMALVPILVRRHIYRASKGRGVGRLRRREKDMSLQFEGRVANECEYEALGILQWTVVFYVVGVQLAGCIAMALYVAVRSDVWELIWESTPGGHSPLVVTALQAVFAFHNSGLSVMEDSLIPIHRDRFLILVHALLITAGNVLFPIFLRIAVWVGHHWWDRKGKRKTAFRYLLRNPRRCTTHLFPSVQTRALLQIWLVTNVVEFVAFLALDFNGPAVADQPPSDRLLDGFFQAVSTRTAGFNVVEISLFSPAMHVLWVMLMYLSSYPFVLTMRHTARFAVAESPLSPASSSPAFTFGSSPGLRPSMLSYGSVQGTPRSWHQMTRSLPALALPPTAAEPGSGHLSPAAPPADVDEPVSAGGRDAGAESDDREDTSAHLWNASPTLKGTFKALFVPPSANATAASELAGIFKGLMLRDVARLYTAIFFICAFDGHNFNSAHPALTVFAVIFEVVSGYGTVGLSLAVPGSATSLSGQFSNASKFIMTIVMLMGRHRGLPDGRSSPSPGLPFPARALDSAVPEVDLARPVQPLAPAPVPAGLPAPAQGGSLAPITARKTVVQGAGNRVAAAPRAQGGTPPACVRSSARLAAKPAATSEALAIPVARSVTSPLAVHWSGRGSSASYGSVDDRRLGAASFPPRATPASLLGLNAGGGHSRPPVREQQMQSDSPLRP